MATPLRKDQPDFENEPEVIEPELIEEDEAEITTGDLARAKKPIPVADARVSQTAAGEPGVPQAGGKVSSGKVSSGNVSSSNVSAINDATPLFPSEELEGLRTRWKVIQTAFVDEPRDAVRQADSLVASAMKRLAEVFADERAGLEQQWEHGDNVSTEDLRVALQRYRTFFERLLSV
jgi:hypothetical protein